MEERFTVECLPETPAPSSSSIFQTDRTVKEKLLQYNLDSSLSVHRFRFTGQQSALSASDYLEVMKSLFGNFSALRAMGCTGEPSLPISIDCEPLSMATMSMTFFDRLEGDIVAPGGRIKGCYEDIIDGVQVNDQLREMLVNENSENCALYSESEKKELIYQLFKLFAIGGELCQPEVDLEPYLNITKLAYKDLVTVYRDNQSNSVQVSGKAFLVRGVGKVELHPGNPDSPHNTCIVIVDTMKRAIRVVKNTRKRFW